MNNTIIPYLCGFSLVAMLAAGGSHWWSVRQFVAFHETHQPQHGISTPAALPRKTPAPTPEIAVRASLPNQPQQPAAAATEKSQKEFFEGLVSRIEHLQNQNRDLLDQIGETNRDMMKLEFRLDTHSEQFRPMPVSEDRIETDVGASGR